MRRAGGGYRGTFGFRKRITLQGGIAATVPPVALLCATRGGSRTVNYFFPGKSYGPRGTENFENMPSSQYQHEDPISSKEHSVTMRT